MIKLTESSYLELDREYCGVCIGCMHVRDGNTEPDAREYPCDECGKDRVYGIQELMIMGLIRLVNSKSDENIRY